MSVTPLRKKPANESMVDIVDALNHERDFARGLMVATFGLHELLGHQPVIVGAIELASAHVERLEEIAGRLEEFYHQSMQTQ